MHYVAGFPPSHSMALWKGNSSVFWVAQHKHLFSSVWPHLSLSPATSIHLLWRLRLRVACCLRVALVWHIWIPHKGDVAHQPTFICACLYHGDTIKTWSNFIKMTLCLYFRGLCSVLFVTSRHNLDRCCLRSMRNFLSDFLAVQENWVKYGFVVRG